MKVNVKIYPLHIGTGDFKFFSIVYEANAMVVTNLKNRSKFKSSSTIWI